MWNLNSDTNGHIYETKIDSQIQRTDLWLPWRSRGRGGMDWEFRISSCKLVYIGCMNNKALLYSTGNYIQYLATNHKGKEYANECRCVYN